MCCTRRRRRTRWSTECGRRYGLKGDMDVDALRYPTGTFDSSQPLTTDKRNGWIADIRDLPEQLRSAVAGLTPAQLDTPYREGGWTVRQVVHHVPDSHMNGYIRFKLALTEEQPTIKPYLEAEWAKLPDYREAPIELSLTLLSALHGRWDILLGSMQSHEFGRAYDRPGAGAFTLDQAVGLYAWHGKHHLAHITGLRQRMGW